MRASRTSAAMCVVLCSLLAACGSEGRPSAAEAGAEAQAPRQADAVAGAVLIYDDALASGWSDWSWGAARSFSNASPVASGARSVAVTLQPWGGLYLRRSSPAAGMATLRLSVNGGAAAGAALLVKAARGSTLLAGVSLAPYCAGGTIPAGAWTTCQVPLTALAPAGAALDGIVVQEAKGLSLPTLYLDGLSLAPAAVPAAPTQVAATAGAGAVSLTWAGCAGATGYDVWRGSARAGPYSRLTAASVAAASYRDTSVAAGRTYWYQVTASSSAGTSAASRSVSATVPGAAQTVQVTASPASATLDGCGTLQLAATVTGTANTAVTWAVQEGAAGGTVDAAGRYTAPATPGTYHVVATSAASSAATATVPVAVKDHVLSVAVDPASAVQAATGAVQFHATVTTTCGTFASSQVVAQ
jgi:chitinase